MDTKSTYYQRLIHCVLNYSSSSKWDQAVHEWHIIDVEEDDQQEESCICGKENLKYLFTIKNFITGATLYPIGSTCIKKFERPDLSHDVDLKVQLFNLLHAIEDDEFLTLSPEHFSRRLITYLYSLDAFTPTSFNNFDPSEDHQFLLDMFNARTRTNKQEKKVTAIILNSIKPFLQKMLKDKVRR